MQQTLRAQFRPEGGPTTNVLLVNSNITRCAKSGYGSTPAPAGLISLAGALIRHGHRVKIGQIHNHVLPQDDESLPLVREEIRVLMEGFSPDLIGISVRNVGAARKPANPLALIQYYSAFYDARLVRAFRMVSSAPIVMGGTAFSIEPGLYLKHAQPDFGLVGEAEESLPALASMLGSGEEPAGIPGLVRSATDMDSACAACGRVADLSTLGVGTCDVVENFAEEYYERGGFAPIQTKRGCPMDCVYCTTPFFEGRTYRYRPMTHVIEEMKAYRKSWGVRHFFIVDSTFNHPLEHAIEVCDGILQAALDVAWFTEVTPACITDELCRMMRKAGCIGVTLTPDSCAESVLKAYGKPFGMAEVRNALTLLKKHGIPFDTCLIIGGPGETEETFAESVAFCSEHLKDNVVRFYDGMIVTRRCGAFAIAVKEGLIDPSRPYENLVSENNFRAVKRYEYFFPHRDGNLKVLRESIADACRAKHWLLTSRDYVPDPETGEFSLRPEIHVEPGARPWWRGLIRKSASE